jgi:hypothetical protein
LSASAIGHTQADLLTRRLEQATCSRQADDGLRTRDLQLGKLALYQLSYVRVGGHSSTLGVALVT